MPEVRNANARRRPLGVHDGAGEGVDPRAAQRAGLRADAGRSAGRRGAVEAGAEGAGEAGHGQAGEDRAQFGRGRARPAVAAAG